MRRPKHPRARRPPRPRAPLVRLTDRLRLGDGGPAVSPVCVGIVREPGTIAAAYEAGINFFFVSVDMHWPYYEETRRGLRQLLSSVPRDEVVVAAVSYVAQPEFAISPTHELLEAVPELDGRIDVHVIGGVYLPDLLPRLQTAERLRRDGFCGMRAVAASFHDRAAAAVAVSRRLVELALVRYNAVHPGARADLFPVVAGAQPRPPLYNFTNIPPRVVDDATWARLALRGYWRPHPTDFYRFALTDTPIDGLLCALARPAQVRELADALVRGPLDEEERQYLVDLCALARGDAVLDHGRSGRR